MRAAMMTIREILGKLEESEFGNAMNIFSGNLGLHLHKNKDNTFGFDGNVPIDLRYERIDGKVFDVEVDGPIARKEMTSGFRSKTYQTRSWNSKDEAIKDAKNGGYKIVRDSIWKDEPEDPRVWIDPNIPSHEFKSKPIAMRKRVSIKKEKEPKPYKVKYVIGKDGKRSFVIPKMNK